jgi:hypothetical protein
MPSACRPPRDWRTRGDPFEEIWTRDVVPLLASDKKGELQATTVMAVLDERYPDRFQPGQVRTLQRRMRDWRAERGPDREVFFEQDHVPGREAQIDFTHGSELEVTVAGMLFAHLLFEYVLCFSGWRFVCLAFGETFEALSTGIQGAVWALGVLIAA